MIFPVAKIVLPDGTQGTAFPVSANLVLTAYHLVGETDGRLRAERLLLQFPAGTVDAEVDSWDMVLDIAILRIDGLPSGCEPLTLAEGVAAGQSWVSTGYPISDPGPVPIDGRVISVDAEIPGNRGPALVLRCWQAGATTPQRLQGFSGAPVVAEAPRRVLGVIRWHPTADDDQRRAPVGGSVYATPASALSARWPNRIGPLVRHSAREAGQRRLTELLRTPPGPDGVLPRIADVDPFEIGVKSTPGSRRYPAVYIPRDHDERVRSLLATEAFTLVVGPPGAGKSRTAYQAALAVFPDARLVQPKAFPYMLRELLDLDEEDLICRDELLIWLDDLENYLIERGGLDLAILGQLARRQPRAIVLATIGQQQCADLLTLGGELQATAGAVLNRADPGRIDLIGRNRVDESLYIYSVTCPDDPPTWQSKAALLAHHGRRREAIEWLRRAGAAGHVPSMQEIADVLKHDGNYEEALQWYRRAAETGDEAAIFEYAAELESRGLLEEAGSWFRRAADDGSRDAATRMGYFLEKHDIGPASEIIRWYKCAAESGHAGSMYRLALWLDTTHEPKEAEYWLRRAIASDDKQAMPGLVRLLWDRYSADMDFEKCRLDADNGDFASMLVMRELAKKESSHSDMAHWLSRARSANERATAAFLAHEAEMAKYADGSRAMGRRVPFSLGRTGKKEIDKQWWPRSCPPLWDQ